MSNRAANKRARARDKEMRNGKDAEETRNEITKTNVDSKDANDTLETVEYRDDSDGLGSDSEREDENKIAGTQDSSGPEVVKEECRDDIDKKEDRKEVDAKEEDSEEANREEKTSKEETGREKDWKEKVEKLSALLLAKEEEEEI